MAAKHEHESYLSYESSELDSEEDFKFVRKALHLDDSMSDRAEFATMDYTPLICIKPIDLNAVIRPRKLGRKIRMLSCVTSFNEEGAELLRTLDGIAANLPSLEKAGLHWSECAVVVVLDGMDRVSPSMLDTLEHELRVFDPSLLRAEHLRRPVTMHLFERTVEIARHATQREYHFPLQLTIAIKVRNGGKLNSHLWFFAGFAAQLNPKYCVTIDVGTAPTPNALTKLYCAMEDDPQCGGAAGELRIRNLRRFHVLDAVQTFEYALSHYMDKAFESVMGFINVLPGAFSIYRWVAIRGEPLAAYFTLEETPARELNPFTCNMYLAEDRVLCFEIVAKRHRLWLLRWVAGATAYTDAPQTLVALIKQRRRWLNGSLFSLLYYLQHFSRVLAANHSLLRKAVMSLQWLFQLMTAVLAWTAVSNMFLTLLLVYGQAASLAPWFGYEIRVMFIFIYGIVMLLQIIIGLAGNVTTSETFYVGVSALYAFTMICSIALGAWLISQGSISWFVGLGIASSLFAFSLAALLHGQFFHVAFVTAQYIVCLPMYVNVFVVYSLCNTHDITWGTKEGGVQNQLAVFHEQQAKRAAMKASRAQARLGALELDDAVQQAVRERATEAAKTQPPKEDALRPPRAVPRDAVASSARPPRKTASEVAWQSPPSRGRQGVHKPQSFQALASELRNKPLKIRPQRRIVALESGRYVAQPEASFDGDGVETADAQQSASEPSEGFRDNDESPCRSCDSAPAAGSPDRECLSSGGSSNYSRSLHTFDSEPQSDSEMHGESTTPAVEMNSKGLRMQQVPLPVQLGPLRPVEANISRFHILGHAPAAIVLPKLDIPGELDITETPRNLHAPRNSTAHSQHTRQAVLVRRPASGAHATTLKRHRVTGTSGHVPSSADLKFLPAEAGAPASYMPYADDLLDRGLELSLTQHADVARAVCRVDDAALRRELAGRLHQVNIAQQAYAARELKLAEEMVADRKKLADDLSAFRINILLIYIISNLLCVAVAVSWDPTLSHYAVAVTWTVIIQMGVKLLGSIVFQLKRLGRAALRQCCLRFCYRVEQDPMNHPRLVCCLRPSSFWALDDLQEAENGYDHSYPDGYREGAVHAEELENRIASGGLQVGLSSGAGSRVRQCKRSSVGATSTSTSVASDYNQRESRRRLPRQGSGLQQPAYHSEEDGAGTLSSKGAASPNDGVDEWRIDVRGLQHKTAIADGVTNEHSLQPKTGNMRRSSLAVPWSDDAPVEVNTSILGELASGLYKRIRRLSQPNIANLPAPPSPPQGQHDGSVASSPSNSVHKSSITKQGRRMSVGDGPPSESMSIPPSTPVPRRLSCIAEEGQMHDSSSKVIEPQNHIVDVGKDAWGSHCSTTRFAGATEGNVWPSAACYAPSTRPSVHGPRRSIDVVSTEREPVGSPPDGRASEVFSLDSLGSVMSIISDVNEGTRANILPEPKPNASVVDPKDPRPAA